MALLGTVVNTPATLQLTTHNNGETVISSIYTDDGYFQPTKMDFTFPFYNGNYATNQVYIGSNSFLTFGAGISTSTITKTSFKGINAAGYDAASKWLSEKLLVPGKSWVVRFEGSAYQDTTSAITHVWEITLFADGVIQLVFGDKGGSSTGWISNQVNDSTALDFTVVANQSWVFVPDGTFTGYTMTAGAQYQLNAPVQSYTKNFSESIVISDSVSKRFTGYKLLMDSIPLSDTIKKVITRINVETITSTETFSKQPRKSFSDSVISSDTTIRKAKSGQLNDSITLTDSTIKKAIQRLKNELMNLIDIVSISKQVFVRFYDAIIADDSFKIKGKEIIGVIELDGEKSKNIFLDGEIVVNVEMGGGIDVTTLNQDILLFQGDSKNLTLTIYGENVNLVGNSIAWGLFRNESSNELLIKKQTSDNTIIIMDSTHFTIFLTGDDTKQLTPGTYYHECKMLDNYGHATTLFVGEMNVIKSHVVNQGNPADGIVWDGGTF
jgi:hypothetical protein